MSTDDAREGDAKLRAHLWRRKCECENPGSLCQCALLVGDGGLDPLVQQTEAAIRLAVELGEDAFDFHEGRGLYQKRIAIQEAVTALRSQQPPLPDVAQGFADQLEKAIQNSASTYGGLAVVLDRDTVNALGVWLRTLSGREVVEAPMGYDRR